MIAVPHIIALLARKYGQVTGFHAILFAHLDLEDYTGMKSDSLKLRFVAINYKQALFGYDNDRAK